MKDDETTNLIKSLKKQYLSDSDPKVFSQELQVIQARHRSNIRYYQLKHNPYYITDHLKLTCRFILKKHSITRKLLPNGSC